MPVAAAALGALDFPADAGGLTPRPLVRQPASGERTRVAKSPRQGAADRQRDIEADVRLMQDLRQGDQAAARHLVDQHLDRLVSYGYRLLNDLAEAEDVAQDAFVRLWRNLDSWRPEAPLIHWLQRVTHNLCIDRLRKRKPVSIDHVPEPVDGAASPAAELFRTEVSETVHLAIQTLPERQRAAILLVHQEGYNNIETAKLMDISIEAVESLLARGRRSLRTQLAGLHQELKGDM